MREILSVSLSKELKKKLNQVSKKYKISQSDVVKGALNKYFSSLEFRDLRKTLQPYAEKKGYYTDEDIFNDKEIS